MGFDPMWRDGVLPTHDVISVLLGCPVNPVEQAAHLVGSAVSHDSQLETKVLHWSAVAEIKKWWD